MINPSKVYEKGFEKTQVVCIPVFSFICVVIHIHRQLIDPNPQAAHPENHGLQKSNLLENECPCFLKLYYHTF